jgi:hypothetical protein
MHTRGLESRAFVSSVCWSFSSPQNFLMAVFCLYMMMHYGMPAHLFLMIFLTTALRSFAFSFPFSSLFLTYELMDLWCDGVTV